MREKYPIDVAPQLVIPIRHKEKYTILDTIDVPVTVNKKEYDKLFKYFNSNSNFSGNIIGAHFVLRATFVPKIKTFVTKHYPKAKFANIICHMITSKEFNKDQYDFHISVDVLG